MAIKFLSGLNLSNVTADSILKLDSNGNIVAAVSGTDYNTASSQFTNTNGGAYYANNLRVGVYQTDVIPEAKIHVYDYQTTDPKLLIEDGNTGDASMQFKISTQSYTMGIDNSDSDKFILAASSALGTTNVIEIATNGATAFQTATLFNDTINLHGDGAGTREVLINAHGTRGKLMKEGNATYWQVAQGGNQFEITDAANGNDTKGNVMLQVHGNDANDNEIYLAVDGGKVGVNTTSPDAHLHVASSGDNGSNGLSDYGFVVTSNSTNQPTIGAESIGDGYANLNLGSNISGTRTFWHISKRKSNESHQLEYYYYNGTGFDSKFTFRTNGSFLANELDLPSGGQLDWANGDARIVEGLVSNYSLSFQTYTGSALTTKMFVSSGGNVGIGTSDPQAKLDVRGSIYVEKPLADNVFVTLANKGTGGDLVEQKSFIDFTFIDSNTNETPQVRIGAEVGNNDGSASSQGEEGMGAFVVYTNNADTDAGVAGTSLAERFRVDYQGKAFFTNNIDVNGAITGNILYTTGTVRVEGTNSALTLRSDVQVGQGDEDPIIEFAYGTTQMGKFDQSGYLYAAGFKTSGTTGFLKSDGTVDTDDFFSGSYSDLSGKPTLGTMAAADTGTYKTSDNTETYVAGELASYTATSSFGSNAFTSFSDHTGLYDAVGSAEDVQDNLDSLLGTLGTAATTASTDYATAAQGTTADAALPKAGGTMTGALLGTTATFTGNGGTVLDVQGSVGQLFSVTDSLTGDLFAVSDISGIPILNVNSSGAVDIDGTLTVDGNISATNFSGSSSGTNTGDQDLSGYLLNTTDTFAGNITFNGGNNNSKESFINVKRGSGAGLWLKFQTDSTTANNVSQFVIRRSTDNVDILSIQASSGNLTVPGTLSGSNFSGSSSGTNTGDQTLPTLSSLGALSASGTAFSLSGTDVAVGESITLAGGLSYSGTTLTSANTTYSVGDNGLTQKNFTSILKTKLDGIEAGADVTDSINVSAAGGMLKAGSETSTAMKAFEANLSNEDDWANSPVSILERDNIATGGNGADKYAPNLNFHWRSRVSNSLWMAYNGILNWGDYSGAGVPAADGTFKTGTLYAGAEDITATKVGQWNTAYGWGDHSGAGYLTSSSTQDKYLRSDTLDVMTYDTTSGEMLKFANNTSGGKIQIGFQQNGTDGMHHRAYLKSYKSTAGNAAGKFDIVVRGAGGSTTSDILELEAGSKAKWQGANLATESYVGTAISNLVDSSPATLNTLNELAAALGDDASFSTTMSTALGNRLRIDVNNQSLSSAELTNARTNLGLGTAATAASTAFISSGGDDAFSGNLTSSSGKYIKFYHSNQTDANDGKIGSGVFASGLNIVGTQTTAGTGRQVRVWGDLINSAGASYLTVNGGTLTGALAGTTADFSGGSVTSRTSTSTAYTPTAYNSKPLLTLKSNNEQGNYSGIRFTNSAGNYEWFQGTVQISGDTADYVIQGHDRAGGVYKEHLRINENSDAAFSGNVSALNLSGTNTGDQTLPTASSLGAVTLTGNQSITGTKTFSNSSLVIQGTHASISFIDTTADSDDWYLHANSNYFYILADRDGGNSVDSDYESPHPLELRATDNSARFFGNQIKSAAYTLSTDYATAAQGTTADAALPKAGGTVTGVLKLDSELQFLRGAGSGDYSDYIRAQNYPSEGYTSSAAKYWLEYGAKGGHHFVLNTDGGADSGENAYDDFTIWNGAVDGNRLLEVTNAGNATFAGSIAALNLSGTNTGDQSISSIKTGIGTGNGKLVPAAGTAGHFLKHDGTFGIPAYTTNTNTTYSAGTGIILSGTTFKLRGGEIPAGINLDTYRSTGVYSQNSNTDASNGANYPVPFAGILEVWNDDYGNGVHCVQRYSRYDTTDVWNRSYYNGNWTAWVNLAIDTNTVYTHPTSAGNKHIPTGGSSGQFLKYSSSGTAVWAADNNTTYSTSDFDAAGSAAAVQTNLNTIAANVAGISNQSSPVDTGTVTIATVATGTYTAAFFDFVIKNGTNVRSGTVYSCHDGTNVEFTETSTVDLGDTSDVTLSVDKSGTSMRLRATSTSDSWIIKSLVRAI